MLLKTLLCHEGRDNGWRLLSITAAVLLFLTLVALLFSGSVMIFIALVGVLPIHILAVLRRLRDSNKSAKFAFVAIVPLVTFGICLYFSLSISVLVSLFLFALASAIYLSFLPSTSRCQYVQGYYGPKLANDIRPVRTFNRQEPSIYANQSVKRDDRHVEPANIFFDEREHKDNVADNDSVIHDAPHFQAVLDDDIPSTRRSFQVDQEALDSGSVTELFKSWLLIAKKHQVGLIIFSKILAVIGVIGLITLLIVWFVNREPSVADEVEDYETEEVINNARTEVKLPDGFWIALEDNVLIVRWLGSVGETKNLWRLASAKGDSTCANLTFNSSSRYRPITVDLVQDGSTEARFSPLDTSAIITDVALRGSFTLCGYDFGLSGSQAALGRNPVFAEMLP